MGAVFGGARIAYDSHRGLLDLLGADFVVRTCLHRNSKTRVSGLVLLVARNTRRKPLTREAVYCPLQAPQGA